MKKESKLGFAGLIREQRYRTEFWCRNTDAGLKQLTTGRNADAGLLFSGIPTFRHLQMIFKYHIARITPSADVYGRAGCVPVHCQQYGRAECVPFYRQQYGGTGIRVPSPVPDCSGTGLRHRMPECRCWRHRPRCRCPAMKRIQYAAAMMTVHICFQQTSLFLHIHLCIHDLHPCTLYIICTKMYMDEKTPSGYVRENN